APAFSTRRTLGETPRQSRYSFGMKPSGWIGASPRVSGRRNDSEVLPAASAIRSSGRKTHTRCRKPAAALCDAAQMGLNKGQVKAKALRLEQIDRDIDGQGQDHRVEQK